MHKHRIVTVIDKEDSSTGIEIRETKFGKPIKGILFNKNQAPIIHVAHSTGIPTPEGTLCAFAATLTYMGECHKVVEAATRDKDALWCEMLAVLVALNDLPLGVGFPLVFSANSDLIDPFAMNLVDAWNDNGWRTEVGEQMHNGELWQKLYKLDNELGIGWGKADTALVKKAKDLADEFLRKSEEKRTEVALSA